MRQGWDNVKLGDVCSVDKRKIHTGELPFVGLEDIKSNAGGFVGSLDPKSVGSATFYFTSRHVLYGRLRPYLNKVLLPEFDGHCSSEIFPLLPFDQLDRAFLYYWITSQSVVDEIDRTCTGTRMPRANVKEILAFDFPLPPLPEQKRIVAILNEAFEGIGRAVANAEKNLANARELFESHLNAVFTRKGEGWIDKTLQNVCEKITDGTHQTPKYFDSGYVFLSSRNVKSGIIDWDNIKYIDESQHLAMQKRLSPRRGDILLAKNGTTGVAAIVDRDLIFDIYVSLALLRPLATITPNFLLHFVNSPVCKRQFNARLKGVGVPNLHLKEIREVSISFPESVAEQSKIVARLDELHASARNLEAIYQKHLVSLLELKQSLLQNAFAGELTAQPHAALQEAVA